MMSVIDNEDMRGAYVGQEVVCLNCLADEEREGLKQDEIITEADIEKDKEKTYFCDRCKNQL